MNITIETLKSFSTEYKGQQQEKYFVEFDGGKKGYAYKGKWNQGWKEGDQVEADVVQGRHPDKQGNTVYNLKCPQHLRPSGFGNTGISGEEVAQTLRFIKKDIMEEIAKAKNDIERSLNELKVQLNGGQPTQQMQDRNAELAKQARQEVVGDYDEMNPPPMDDSDLPF